MNQRSEVLSKYSVCIFKLDLSVVELFIEDLAFFVGNDVDYSPSLESYEDLLFLRKH